MRRRQAAVQTLTIHPAAAVHVKRLIRPRGVYNVLYFHYLYRPFRTVPAFVGGERGPALGLTPRGAGACIMCFACWSQ